jgi:hypothetical protein
MVKWQGDELLQVVWAEVTMEVEVEAEVEAEEVGEAVETLLLDWHHLQLKSHSKEAVAEVEAALH